MTRYLLSYLLPTLFEKPSTICASVSPGIDVFTARTEPFSSRSANDSDVFFVHGEPFTCRSESPSLIKLTSLRSSLDWLLAWDAAARHPAIRNSKPANQFAGNANKQFAMSAHILFCPQSGLPVATRSIAHTAETIGVRPARVHFESEADIGGNVYVTSVLYSRAADNRRGYDARVTRQFQFKS